MQNRIRVTRCRRGIRSDAREFKNGSCRTGSPGDRGSEKIAAGIKCQFCFGREAIGSVKRDEGLDGRGAVSNFKDGARAEAVVLLEVSTAPNTSEERG